MRVRLTVGGIRALVALILLVVAAPMSVRGSSPVAVVGGPYAGVVGLPVRVEATADIRDIGGVYWEFGDGSSDRGLRATKVYDAPGVYDVTVTVKDSAGRAHTATTTAVIRSAPE